MAGRRHAIDVVIPARNEGLTVADVVLACHGCRYVRDIIVVDDGSTDDTAAKAAGAGARVVARTPGGSKAHAMRAGVDATDAEAVFFVDADLLGLRSHHLDAICEPVVDGRAVMSIGTFDYGAWNPVVLRFPPTTGERVLPRWAFDAVAPDKLDGYTIEVMINEVIAEGRLLTTARVMKGVTHRTKRDKFGPVEGWRRSWRMFWQLVGLARVVRLRTYWFYLRDLTIET
ncbi:MAG TPA: glycosyltransferase family 2 protein [Acidimicrobiales bacterium]|nr:glycosyltransferase family 2 protein [Acidimicrobiales bacterium]